MTPRLVSMMISAPDFWTDEMVAQEVRETAVFYHIPGFEDHPFFAKSVTIAPDQVAMKAQVIFGETIEP